MKKNYFFLFFLRFFILPANISAKTMGDLYQELYYLKEIRDKQKAVILNTDELMAYSGLGRNKSVILGDEIGARVQIGKRVLWDRVKIDAYFDSLTGVK